ncbi:MAG: hypothetical protein KGI75_18650 [Rhizobiaceae bacterium]|nr:hypothetical protein [Rhizobiaceae bacterium]
MSRVIRMVVNYCIALLGPGRSTVRWGSIGMIVAPFVAVLTFPVPYLLISFIGGPLSPFTENDLSIVIAILVVTYLAAVAITVVVGIPAWLAFRWFNRESGWVYALVGAVVGLVPPYLVLMDAPVGPFALASQYVLYASCAACGMVAALSFWAIARQR